MRNQEHLDILKKGVEVWNQWRQEHPDIQPDLSDAPLSGTDLTGINLSGVNLSEADLSKADLSDTNLVGVDFSLVNISGVDFSGANLSGKVLLNGKINFNKANLSGANLSESHFGEATFSKANLNGANLDLAGLSGTNFTKASLNNAQFYNADLSEAILIGANLSNAVFELANLSGANLSGANLSGANFASADLTRAYLNKASCLRTCLIDAELSNTDLSETNLSGADLTRADLGRTKLLGTNLTEAILTGCHIYGISAWNVELEGAIQKNLVITPRGEPEITVDNLKVAQFIYLLLNNQEIRDVIDTITSKVVLILGRFTPERKKVLYAIKDKLAEYNYLPVLFDFDPPHNRDLTETVGILARLARFVIADLTDPNSIPHELYSLIPDLRNVPFQPILEASKREYPMFEAFGSYSWVLPIHRYSDSNLADLLASLKKEVIDAAEKKVNQLIIEKAKRLERP